MFRAILGLSLRRDSLPFRHMVTMAEIFICYRRDDSGGYAGWLHDALLDHFGARAVFVDVENLYPGDDFEDVIQKTLSQALVVLVVIGPHWLDERLRNAGDYVRREIMAAIAGEKRLIPVLVGDARMPTREELPVELAALAGKNAVTLRHATWKADVSRLGVSLEQIIAHQKSVPGPAAVPDVLSPPAPLLDDDDDDQNLESFQEWLQSLKR